MLDTIESLSEINDALTNLLLLLFGNWVVMQFWLASVSYRLSYLGAKNKTKQNNQSHLR